MENGKILIYDGSFNGFLTAIFVAFDEKIIVSDIQKNTKVQRGLFSDNETVFTQMDKAKRVWNGIRNKSHSAIKDIYFAFLSETKDIEHLLYRYIRRLFSEAKSSPNSNYADALVLKISQLARSVGREKHRMEAFVRFQLTKDEIFFAHIEPDFDVLPLISKHFRNRYGDQQWIIYDVKRSYGLYYNLSTVEIIALDLQGIHSNDFHKSDTFLDTEYGYQELWNNYFKSTNIKSRINNKLHQQHMPKRYLKYLNEKKAVS